LIASLVKRLKKYESNSILRISMLLDPRFCYDTSTCSKIKWESIEEDLIKFGERNLEAVVESHENFTAAEKELQINGDYELEGLIADEKPIKHNIWESMTEEPIKSSTALKLQEELIVFKSLKRPSIEIDIFAWWKDHVALFPLLSSLARILHSIPAASACSERLFSKAGLIYSNTLRNCLSAPMANSLLTIKANMDSFSLGPAIEKDQNYDAEE